MLNQETILKALEGVKAPGSRSDIVVLNQVQQIDVKEKSVVIVVALTEDSQAHRKSLEYQISQRLKEFDADAQVAVDFVSAENEKPQISAMIAVASGKGGVGKSTISVNLAIALKELGYRVGYLDCDIYGPSAPTLLGLEGQKPMMLKGKVVPLEAHGLKVMSAGFFVDAGQGLIWRGPMIHKLIQQFYRDVAWGELDILIIDLPPGTGDAPLSLSQTLPLTGAVMVSLAPRLSLVDVHKSISMFQQVKVPVLGLVENMSVHTCGACGHEEEIFDRGSVKKFAQEMGVPYFGDIPIDARLRKQSDSGRPFLLDYADTAAGKALNRIAQRLVPTIQLCETSQNEVKIVL